jgi:hypothetical protein
MRPERCWSVILTMGLFMGLMIPLNAQAGPNRTFAPQPNRQAFTRPQPRACAPQVNRQSFNRPQPRPNGWNGQPHQWQQPRGHAYGWQGHQRQWDHRNAYGRQGWQQPRGQATGWNGQDRQWRQPQRNAHGWQGQPRNWQQQQPRGQSVGWNGERSRWQQHPENGASGPQHRQSSGQGDRPGYQHSQSPNQNQESSRPAYTPIGYSGTHQTPSASPGSFTGSSNASGPWGRSNPQSGFHGPQSSGSSHQVLAEPNQVSN